MKYLLIFLFLFSSLHALEKLHCKRPIPAWVCFSDEGKMIVYIGDDTFQVDDFYQMETD